MAKKVEQAYKMLEFLLDSDSEDEVVEEFVANMAREEASSSSIPRVIHTRAFIPRDREQAATNLYNHYFAENPVYRPKEFNRRFRMRIQLFLRIIEGITTFSTNNTPDHFMFFRKGPDALGRQPHTIYQKCTSAMRQLAYGQAPDTLDEYLQMSEKSSALCLDNFCKCIFDLYGREYLRRPNAQDIARIYSHHEEKHGLPGMLGSIDCMHWQWKNCPVAWQGQYTRGDQKGPTILLEAVASQDMWIWHAFFGMAGSNNDINVLNNSPLFNTIKNGTAPPSPFTVNGHHYETGYYLGDGIYPDWAMLVKAPHAPTDEKRRKFKRFQESARKDIERAFGVLQGRFAILKIPARSMDYERIRRHMYCCIILHNMIQEDKGFVIDFLEQEFLADRENMPRREPMDLRDRDARIKELRDRRVHSKLHDDLTEHVWNLPPNFRTHT